MNTEYKPFLNDRQEEACELVQKLIDICDEEYVKNQQLKLTKKYEDMELKTYDQMQSLIKHLANLLNSPLLDAEEATNWMLDSLHEINFRNHWAVSTRRKQLNEEKRLELVKEQKEKLSKDAALKNAASKAQDPTDTTIIKELLTQSGPLIEKLVDKKLALKVKTTVEGINAENAKINDSSVNKNKNKKNKNKNNKDKKVTEATVNKNNTYSNNNKNIKNKNENKNDEFDQNNDKNIIQKNKKSHKNTKKSDFSFQDRINPSGQPTRGRSQEHYRSRSKSNNNPGKNQSGNRKSTSRSGPKGPGQRR